MKDIFLVQKQGLIVQVPFKGKSCFRATETIATYFPSLLHEPPHLPATITSASGKFVLRSPNTQQHVLQKKWQDMTSIILKQGAYCKVSKVFHQPNRWATHDGGPFLLLERRWVVHTISIKGLWTHLIHVHLIDQICFMPWKLPIFGSALLLFHSNFDPELDMRTHFSSPEWLT